MYLIIIQNTYSSSTRSYEEAVQTDHLCSTYQCEDWNQTHVYATNLKLIQSFSCYYRPESVKHVYLHSGSHSQSISTLGFYVICTFIGFSALFIWCILPVLKFIYRHRQSCWSSDKQLTRSEEDPYLYVVYV